MALGFSLLNLSGHFGFKIVTPQFGQNVLDFVSDLLLVLIIMEVLGTVRSYLEKGDTSVKPFMFIGIISATRGILSIGARLSIQGTDLKGDEFRNDMIELGINAIIIIALGSTLKIMGDTAEVKQDDSSPPETSAPAPDIIERVTVETTIPAHQHHTIERQPDTLSRNPAD